MEYVTHIKQAPAVRMLALATGTIGGFLVALVVQIMLPRLTIGIETAWHDLIVASAAQIRSALAWWLLAGTALVAGFLVAAITRFLILNWWPLRALRWVAGAAVVASLAAVGHIASEASPLDAAMHVAANMAGMAASLTSACVGAYFAARR